MIVDCFTFFNEFDLLEIRLHELDPWVDRFVLVESAETFSGNKKPLWFEKNKHRFESFLPKITYLVSPLAEKPKTDWDRQINQRDYATHILAAICVDEDLIMISDVDEIPMGRDFIQLQADKERMTVFIQKNYMFYMNLRRAGGWPGPVILPYKTLKSIYNNSLFKARMARRSGEAAKNGGWHFTKLGGRDAVVLKAKSSSHFRCKSYQAMAHNPEYLHTIMESERRIKGRKLVVVPITDDYPLWFRENIDKFKHLLTEEV